MLCNRPHAASGENSCSGAMSAMVPKISESTSPVAPICPVCSAVPPDPTDQFCRRCGCQLKLTCAHCNGKIRPFDRYCASCGARRLIIFDQIRQYMYFRSPFFIVGLSVAMAGAWMGLRYILKGRLPARR
ncbi:unnamed protein product [Cylicocyclus nassatus]|uniref:DZANK-type domain-containing protein n=1 Tax=Cylicocyclus nassatus TaxID=53992 RepID=A0AA36M1A4_CYLNA|nr:unnamed protein product [Cylicocyclus nassatus]